HRHAAVGVEDGVLTVLPLRRVGEAGVAAGPVAGQAGAVVPATRVLGDVAADRAGVADLRAGHFGRRFRQQLVALVDERVPLDLADLGERADLDTVRRFLDAVHLGNSGEIDHDFGPLDAVLEPGQRVVAPGEFPDVG